MTDEEAKADWTSYASNIAQALAAMAAKRICAWNLDAIRWSAWFGKSHATISAHDNGREEREKDV